MATPTPPPPGPTPGITQIVAEAPASAPTPAPTVNRTPSPVTESEMPLLAALLPAEAGYTWGYSGFGEYAHIMQLTSIQRSADQITYRMSGNVLQIPSDGAAADNSINLTYTVYGDRIVQRVKSVMMMDADIPEMELIHAPLAKGTFWVQDVVTSDGKPLTLQCEIVNVGQQDGKAVYTVCYSDPTGEYVESRIIKEGTGVLYYEKAFPNGEELIWMSYLLREVNDTPFPQISPYPTRTPIR